MRITRSDNQQLVVLDFPWLIPAVFLPVGTFMLVVGLFAVSRALNKPGFAWFGAGSGGMWGALAAGFLGVGVGSAFCVRSEFTFDLAVRRLTWSRRSLFKTTGGVVPFEQIRYAFTQRCYDGDGDAFCVTLRTDAGPLPLSPFCSSNQARKDAIRDAINRALNAPFSDRELMESHIY